MTDDTQKVHTGGAGAWLLGACMVVLGLLGLVMASGTHDDAMYAIGLLVFLINAFAVFLLISRFAGRHHRPDSSAP